MYLIDWLLCSLTQKLIQSSGIVFDRATSSSKMPLRCLNEKVTSICLQWTYLIHFPAEIWVVCVYLKSQLPELLCWNLDNSFTYLGYILVNTSWLLCWQIMSAEEKTIHLQIQYLHNVRSLDVPLSQEHWKKPQWYRHFYITSFYLYSATGWFRELAALSS